MREKLQDAVDSEHVDSVAYVASHNLPIQAIFSSNESFRTPLAEFAYQRWRIESQEIKSLDELPPWTKWPEKGQWAPRYESRKGEHAGITTNNLFPQAVDALRLKLVTFYSAMWCDVVQSSFVSTGTLLDLTFHSAGAPNFRTQPNTSDLAAKPVCTTCHARLDYGSQFYKGWTSQNLGLNYDPRRQVDTVGPLYMRDIDDPRGEGPRNPAGFVKLALAQPEFASCMANEFTTRVFGKTGVDDNDQLVSSLEDLVRKQASYRELFERTLEYYTDKQFAANDAHVAPVKSGLVAMVDEQCSSCHDADDKKPPGIFAKYEASWCKAIGARCPDTALDMLVVVANRRMPKSSEMTSAERTAMIEELGRYAWPDPKQRDAAVKFFLEEAIGDRPVHSSSAIIESIHSVVPGSPPDKTTAVETFKTFGTSLAAEIGVSAARVCSTQQDKVGCIRRALAPSRVFK